MGGDLPFLPRVSAITFSYFIYPFIGYADYFSLYVRLLHVILSVVVFSPRASNINQPKALIGGEAYHIDTYEQMAIRLAGPIESPLGGAGMCPSYFLLRPQQLVESSSSHLVVSGRRCLSKSLKSVNRCAEINLSETKEVKQGGAKEYISHPLLQNCAL